MDSFRRQSNKAFAQTEQDFVAYSDSRPQIVGRSVTKSTQTKSLPTENSNIEFEKSEMMSKNNNGNFTFSSPFYRRRKPELYAALDLGTNNCRLLIARPTKPGFFRVVDSYSHIVRLGEGLGSTGVLSQDAMDRTLSALEVCRLKLERQNIAHQWLVTTEACRRAANGMDFVHQVQQKIGLELDIVNRETEARLAVSGCGTLVDPMADAVILFDIGGGSSEIALLDVSHRTKFSGLAKSIVEWESLPVGVVTLAEQFGSDALTKQGFEAMKAYVSELLAEFATKGRVKEYQKNKKIHFLGASGTVTMLASMSLKLQRYNRSLVDGMWLGNQDIERLLATLLDMDMEEKIANPCIGPGRADLILAGCAIMESIRTMWPKADVRVADRGLREGILTELMSKQGAWKKNKKRKYNRAPEHKKDK